MRLGFSALITGTVLSVSLLAHATSAPKTATVNSTPSPHSDQASNTGDGVARVTAILGYCSKVDRRNAGDYRRALAHILSGNASSKADESSSAGIRSIDQELRILPVGTVTTACRNFLAGK